MQLSKRLSVLVPAVVLLAFDHFAHVKRFGISLLLFTLRHNLSKVQRRLVLYDRKESLAKYLSSISQIVYKEEQLVNASFFNRAASRK